MSLVKKLKMKDKVILYIATQNKTGKKYFGKTSKYVTEEELQRKYHGSGSYWIRHLNKHGDDVTMKIFKVCSLNENDKDYVKPIALKFSEENDIVNSKEWANLKLEDGLFGGSDKGENNPCFGIPKTAEHIEKIRLKSLMYRHNEKIKEKLRRPKNKVCCLNCKKEISVNNFSRHELPCTRVKIIKSNKGKNNPRALKINIFNQYNELIYSCDGDFVTTCKQNNLPYNNLRISYKNNGEKIFQTLSDRQIIGFTKPNKIIFKGWYALELR